jgi:hypothetical protein
MEEENSGVYWKETNDITNDNANNNDDDYDDTMTDGGIEVQQDEQKSISPLPLPPPLLVLDSECCNNDLSSTSSSSSSSEDSGRYWKIGPSDDNDVERSTTS